MADEELERPAVENNAEEEKSYSCQYCDRKFYSSQALGGHQNGHKRERTASKRAQKELDLYIDSPFLSYPPTGQHYYHHHHRHRHHHHQYPYYNPPYLHSYPTRNPGYNYQPYPAVPPPATSIARLDQRLLGGPSSQYGYQPSSANGSSWMMPPPPPPPPYRCMEQMKEEERRVFLSAQRYQLPADRKQNLSGNPDADGTTVDGNEDGGNEDKVDLTLRL